MQNSITPKELNVSITLKVALALCEQAIGSYNKECRDE